MSTAGSPRPTLLYDGDCGFCKRSIEWIKARDPQALFDYTPAQNYPNLSPELLNRATQEVILLTPSQTLFGARAALTVFHTIKPYHPIGIFRFPPFLWLATAVYRFIARNRHNISRWLKIPAACAVPHTTQNVDPPT